MAKRVKCVVVLEIDVADKHYADDLNALATGVQGLLRSQDRPDDPFYVRDVTVYADVADVLKDVRSGDLIDEGALEKMWFEFSDVPVNNLGYIEEPFYFWSPGVHREVIWRWFDERSAQGVHGLMYPREGVNGRET